MTAPSRYRRVMVKISGEALLGGRAYGVDPAQVDRIAAEIVAASRLGVRIALVIGGGNIFRGVAGAAQGMERATADYMGMLATVINALALENALERLGADARVQSAIPMPTVCEPYVRPRAVAHMEKGRIVIFAAGTGSPFFTTDTAAALRAIEMGCDAFFKATQVDGVYSADPKIAPDAVRYDRLTYTEVLARNLKVMDATAISLSREHGLPVVVFALHGAGGLAGALRGNGTHTLITEGEDHG